MTTADHDAALALAEFWNDEPDDNCTACGHWKSEHLPRFGCTAAVLDSDGETWLGCGCELIPDPRS